MATYGGYVETGTAAPTNTANWIWDVTNTTTMGNIFFTVDNSTYGSTTVSSTKKKKKPQPQEKNGQLLFW